MNVRPAEIASEPRQPRRLEKKKNMWLLECQLTCRAHLPRREALPLPAQAVEAGE